MELENIATKNETIKIKIGYLIYRNPLLQIYSFHYFICSKLTNFSFLNVIFSKQGDVISKTVLLYTSLTSSFTSHQFNKKNFIEPPMAYNSNFLTFIFF